MSDDMYVLTVISFHVAEEKEEKTTMLHNWSYYTLSCLLLYMKKRENLNTCLGLQTGLDKNNKSYIQYEYRYMQIYD